MAAWSSLDTTRTTLLHARWAQSSWAPSSWRIRHGRDLPRERTSIQCVGVSTNENSTEACAQHEDHQALDPEDFFQPEQSEEDSKCAENNNVVFMEISISYECSLIHIAPRVLYHLVTR